MTLDALWRDEYRPLVDHLRRRFRLTPEDAEDIAAEAFAEMAETGGAGTGLLYRRAQSRAVNLLVRGEAPSLDRDDALYTTELRVDLTRAIGTLPCREREAFALTELRGLTEREAALQLGISQPTVHRLVEAARTLLRQELTA